MQIVIDDDLLNFMGEQESQFLIKPSSLINEIRERKLYGEKSKGDTLPWRKTHPLIRLRPGEVSLWAGISGHGKSQMLGQVCSWGLNNKWLIASMEMTPVSTIERMIKQISGADKTSEEYISKILNWMDSNLWLYDQTDSIASDRILALVRYAVTKNIDHIVIDSLMKCGIRKDDLEAQAKFMDKICWLAKTNKIHIHIVHHMRKSDSEIKIPDKYDCRGAGEIIDLVDNIFIVHRNKQKEADNSLDVNRPDCWLKIAKQRHYSFEGIFNLWFHKASGQFVGDPNRVMTHWFDK